MVTKIRIIYTGEDEILKEYVKCFFEFIGVMVCEYELEKSGRCTRELTEIPYDKSVVNIALGSIVPYVQEYKGHPNLEFLYARFNETNDEVKAEAREKLLDELISKIWEKDSINLPVVQRIRKLFVSAEENRDLFYILYGEQIVREINLLFDELAEKGAIKPLFDDYIQDKFNELLSVFQILSNENKEGKLSSSPYGEFAFINVQNHNRRIISLFKKQIRHQNIAYLNMGEQELMAFVRSLGNKTIPFIHKYPQFSSAKYLAISLGVNPLDYCTDLMLESRKFREKKYYSKAALTSALVKEQYGYPGREIIKDYKLALEYNPLSIEAGCSLAEYIIRMAPYVDEKKREENADFLDRILARAGGDSSLIPNYYMEELVKALNILKSILSLYPYKRTTNHLILKIEIDIINRICYLDSGGLTGAQADNAFEIANSINPNIFRKLFKSEEFKKVTYSIMMPFKLNCIIKCANILEGYGVSQSLTNERCRWTLNRLKSYYMRGPQEEEKQPTESEDNKTFK